jgi:hypothetical protein
VTSSEDDAPQPFVVRLSAPAKAAHYARDELTLLERKPREAEASASYSHPGTRRTFVARETVDDD